MPHTNENLYWLLNHDNPGPEQRTGGFPDIQWVDLGISSDSAYAAEASKTTGSDMWDGNGKHYWPTPNRNKDILIKYDDPMMYLDDFPSQTFQMFWIDAASQFGLVTLGGTSVIFTAVWVGGNKQIDCIRTEVGGVERFYDAAGNPQWASASPQDKLCIKVNGPDYASLGGYPLPPSGWSQYMANNVSGSNMTPQTAKTGNTVTISQAIIVPGWRIEQYIQSGGSNTWDASGNNLTNPQNKELYLAKQISFGDYSQ